MRNNLNQLQLMKLFTFFLITISILIGCAQNTRDTSKNISTKETTTPVHLDSLATPKAVAISSPHYNFPYQLRQPNQSFKMPNKLEEISGLCIAPNNKFLYTIQDEKGNVYKIDITSGEVVEKFDFGKNGDYEGIAIYQDIVFITRSNGTIYEVKNLGKENQDVSNYKTDLKGKNDIEGFCYQPSSNSLLLACKGIPTMGETTEEAANRKFIYRFDLTTRKLIPEPYYKITLKKVQQFLKEASYSVELQNFQSYLNQNNSFKFSPSGIAIHPKTNEVYILSSSKKMLLIINEAGEIQYLAKLNKKIHRQPEGIAFTPDGTLYIANEGKGGHGTIHVYKAK